MPKGIKVCKVCGKEYQYCKTETNDKFRWQDVACSPEHAAQYFADVAASRGGAVTANAKKKNKKKTRIEKTPELVVDETIEVEENTEAEAPVSVPEAIDVAAIDEGSNYEVSFWDRREDTDNASI